MKKYFITYATPKYIDSAKNIINSAKFLGKFDETKLFTNTDIDDKFLKRNEHILKNERGAGYWLWKPYIILKQLLELNDGDILCYCDTQFLFLDNIDIIIKDILPEDQDIGITHNKPNERIYLEKQFSKGDAFLFMNAFEEEIRNTPQCWAGFVIFRKSFESILFVSNWLAHAQNEKIINDTPSMIVNNDNYFIDNRHDQTVLSLLAKKWKIKFNNFPLNTLHNIRVPVP